MASDGNSSQDPPPPSVFLSYASQDRDAARSLRDALADAGLEVWYDENELGGGEAWDQKIRRQIRECDYFMPVVSAQTEARHEGYFRREWRLAVDRTLDMADGHLFLIPVVIDDTDQNTARVPDRFIAVQWIKVPNGQMTPSLKALIGRLASGSAPAAPAPRRKGPRSPGAVPPPLHPALPEFPVEEPGQRLKFMIHVAAWSLKSLRILFKGLPRWIRFIVYIWLFLFLLSRGCSVTKDKEDHFSPASAAKLKAAAEAIPGLPATPGQVPAGLQGVVDIARAIADDDGKEPVLLAIPFNGAAGGADGAKAADSAFVSLYGRLSISHRGQVGAGKDPLASLDPGAAAERGRASHSAYVLCGAVENSGASALLTVEIVKVSDASLLWSKSYPVPATDSAAIAADAESHVPPLGED
jgi:TolB-like protein